MLKSVVISTAICAKTALNKKVEKKSQVSQSNTTVLVCDLPNSFYVITKNNVVICIKDLNPRSLECMLDQQ